MNHGRLLVHVHCVSVFVWAPVMYNVMQTDLSMEFFSA